MSKWHEGAALEAADDLAAACADVLGANLMSAILHGSLTQEDFRPGKSDLDLLLVVQRALTRDQAQGLVEVVRAADLGPAAGIDLLVVTAEAAEARSAAAPARELLVGRGSGTGDELEIEGPAENVSDNWPELSEARANGRSLIGPEPTKVIGRVPVQRVHENSVGHLRRWLGLTDDTRNSVFMVVTACRMWRFELTGDHVSKSAAARWALEREPDLGAVRSALVALSASRASEIAPAEVEKVLFHVLGDLEEPSPV